MTDGVWLNSLYLSIEAPDADAMMMQDFSQPQVIPPEIQTLVLKGTAVSPSPGEETAVVGKFIESLRDNKDFFADFQDIKVTTIERKKLGQIEVMDFTIVCYFKEGRRYFEKLEASDLL